MNQKEKQKLIDNNHPKLSVRQQCKLIGLNRSNLYYGAASGPEENLLLMRLMGEEHTRHPFKGVLEMQVYLRDLGYSVNVKRARRLLRLMGLEAVCPKKNLSKANQAHKKYPYLLKGLAITVPSQVWCSDITYSVPGVRALAWMLKSNHESI